MQAESSGRSYRVLETLGRGGFGVVYRAELEDAEGFKKQVALKVIRDSEEAPDDLVARLRDEARILGLIRHRAVVRVDRLAKLDQGWAVVMEYVEGLNLSSVVRRQKVPTSVALEIAEEVASALHAAWEKPAEQTGKPLRLVHRDIKPANIRITPGGEVKVLDFGVARADFGHREAETQAFRFGTVRYMSPERHDGVEQHACDVYALGIVFAECLAGQTFSDPPTHHRRHASFVEDVVDVCREAVQARGESLAEADVEDMLGLLQEMIAYEPEDRPEAGEVVRQFQGLRERVRGTWLKRWAEANLPALLEARRQARARREPKGDESPSILLEASTMGLGSQSLGPVTGSEPATQPTGTLRQGVLLAAGSVASVAAFGAALVVIGGGLLGWLWWQEQQGGSPAAKIPAATASVAAPAAPQAPAPEAPPVEVADDAVEEPATDEVPENEASAGAAPEGEAPDEAPAELPSEVAAAGDAAPEPEAAEAAAAPATPAPAPKAAPKPRPRPAPEPQAAPADEPDPMATISLAGTELMVQLRQDGVVHWLPGRVPPGRYFTYASKDGRSWTMAGNLTVTEGGTVQLTCNSFQMTCEPK